MPDPIMYQEDCFVVLETDKTEQFLSREELLEKLKILLESLTEELPRELQKIMEIEEKAEYLIDNFCELDLGEGQYFQWYVVRLEK